VNVVISTSGCYLNFGLEILFNAGILLVDGVGCEVMVVVVEGDWVWVYGGDVYVCDDLVVSGIW